MWRCGRRACRRRVMKACGKLLTRFCRGSIAGLREMSRRRKRGRLCAEFLRISSRFRCSRLGAIQDSSRTWEQVERSPAVQDLQRGWPGEALRALLFFHAGTYASEKDDERIASSLGILHERS